MRGISVSTKPLYYYKRYVQQAPVLNLPVMEANLIVWYNSEFNEYGVSHLTTIDMKYCKRYCRPHTVFRDSVWIGIPIKHKAYTARSLQYLKDELLGGYSIKFSANQ